MTNGPSTEPVDGELASMLAECARVRLWAEQDEGPYHRSAQLERRDVVEDREGTALQLGIRLMDDRGNALTTARVEIWQCDAHGRYSGFPPPDPSVIATEDTAPRTEYLADQTFLRGSQRADRSGMVEFGTIFPGWYPGRTVHIHIMVHAAERSFTSQLYFPDDLSDEILIREPYARRPGRDTTNDTDEIFPTGGSPAVVDTTPVHDGYRAAITLVLPTEKAPDSR